MTDQQKKNLAVKGFETGKYALIVCGLTLGYNAYKDLSGKLDTIIEIRIEQKDLKDEINKHEASDNMYHSSIDSRLSKIETYHISEPLPSNR